jgi:tetratricopeptide (TPR) repeat protein
MDLGDKLTAHSLELSRKAGVSPAVRVRSEIYYAWNRDNNGFRDDENVRLLRLAVKESRENNLSPRETADALYNLGSDLELRGRLAEAEQAFQQALQVYGQDPAALCDQSAICGDLAYIKQMNGDIAASLPLFQRAYDGYKTCSGPDSRGALTEQEFPGWRAYQAGTGARGASHDAGGDAHLEKDGSDQSRSSRAAELHGACGD